MKKTAWITIPITLLLAACQTIAAQSIEPIPTEPPVMVTPVNPPSIITPAPNLPNPASAFCTDQGYTLEIRTAADGSQSGVCIFPDGSECDEWAYFRNECGPANPGSPTSNPSTDTSAPGAAPAEIPTPLPIDPADYQGWWTYTHPVYNFSIMLPEDWIVEEITNDPLLNDHMLSLHPKSDVEKANIRMTFRRAGEDTLLWPTGVGEGEFVAQGTLDVAGQPATRVYLVCPTGQVNSIWYHGGENEANIQRGDLEFGFLFSYTGVYCQEGYSLGGKVQHVGEMIVASLSL